MNRGIPAREKSTPRNDKNKQIKKPRGKREKENQKNRGVPTHRQNSVTRHSGSGTTPKNCTTFWWGVILPIVSASASNSAMASAERLLIFFNSLTATSIPRHFPRRTTPKAPAPSSFPSFNSENARTCLVFCFSRMTDSRKPGDDGVLMSPNST